MDNAGFVRDSNNDDTDNRDGPFTIYINYPIVTDLDEDHLDLDSDPDMTYCNSRPHCTTEEDGVSVNSGSVDFECLDKEGEEKGEKESEDAYSRCSSNRVWYSRTREVNTQV
jgi:hypothetical protein